MAHSFHVCKRAGFIRSNELIRQSSNPPILKSANPPIHQSSNPMLLSLIGEQPIPVLLVDRALKPAQHILAHSERTRRVAENLETLLPHAQTLPLQDPYDLEGIRTAFERVYQPGMIFNLTGGTKPMAWAGYDVARSRGAQVVYLESEKKQSKLYRFDFSNLEARQVNEILPSLLTVSDYLAAHGL
ncbi:MAG: DUF1887 family CARF protein, partial [Candidatus Caldarchaeum sp.]